MSKTKKRKKEVSLKRKKEVSLPHVPASAWKAVEDFAAAFDALPTPVADLLNGNLNVQKLLSLRR